MPNLENLKKQANRRDEVALVQFGSAAFPLPMPIALFDVLPVKT
jgi:hypothetical protein